MLWEKSCHTYKLFLSAKAAMVLRSQHKNRQIDGANYSTQLPFSVNTNVVPKLFTLPTYSQNYERRAGKRFFLSIYDVT